jgi:hypothetical protein
MKEHRLRMFRDAEENVWTKHAAMSPAKQHTVVPSALSLRLHLSLALGWSRIAVVQFIPNKSEKH